MTLSIATWNVNGVRAITTKGNLAEFVAQYKPDILCLQEIRADVATTKIMTEKLGFSQPPIINSSQVKKGYSGTAILTNKAYVADISHSFPAGINEGRVSAIEFDTFILVNVYTPNSGSALARLEYRIRDWDIAFINFINDLKTKYPKKHIIVVGDINVAHKEIDIHSPQTNLRSAGFTIEERSSFDAFLVSTKLVDVFRELHPKTVKYTYWSNFRQSRANNKGWRIDYALVTPSLMKQVKDIKIYDDVMGSDHCPVVLQLKV